MIRVDLDVMLARRKMQLKELSEKVDITMSNLKTGKARAVRFSSLDKICRVLQCQPGEILIFVDEKDINNNGS